METNAFSQYRTDDYHKRYRGIPIARLEEFKKFRQEEKASIVGSLGDTTNVSWRYVFRGPRVGNDGFTLKCKANRFDVYRRYKEPEFCKFLI